MALIGQGECADDGANVKCGTVSESWNAVRQNQKIDAVVEDVAALANAGDDVAAALVVAAVVVVVDDVCDDGDGAAIDGAGAPLPLYAGALYDGDAAVNFADAEVYEVLFDCAAADGVAELGRLDQDSGDADFLGAFVVERQSENDGAMTLSLKEFDDDRCY